MAGYIGSKASVVSSGAERKKVFNITGATTSLTGCNYTVGKVQVFQNGVRLLDGTDYTATDGTTVTLTVAAQSGDNVVVLSFASYQVALSGIDDQSNAVAMTIDSSENVMLGTTNTSLQLSSSEEGFTYANNFTTVSRNGGTTAYFNRLSSDGDIVAFRKGGTTVGSVGTFNDYMTVGSGDTGLLMYNGGDTIRPHNMSTNTARDNAIDLGSTSDRFKDIYTSGGIYLGGTAAVNKLDDYEEGSFTPFMRINNGVEGITYNGRSGTYTKVGNLVTVMVYMHLSSKGTNVGSVSIDGLPFTAGDNLSSTSFNGTSSFTYFQNIASSVSSLGGWVDDGTTEMYLRHIDGGGNTNTQNTNNTHLNNNSDFRFFITYMAA